MKKIISLLLTLCLIFSLIACSKTETGESNTTPEPVGNQTPEEKPNNSDNDQKEEENPVDNPLNGSEIGADKDPLKKFKIVYMYSNFTDKTGSQFKSCLEYIADDMNVEFVFVEGGYGEAAISALESAVAAGDVDGILLQSAPSSGLLNASNGIPLMVVGNTPPSEEAAAECATFPNYLGCILENSYESGVLACDALYEAGCRNIGFAGLTQGMTSAADDRARGFLDRAAEYADMNIVAEDYSRGQYAAAVSSFAAAYPEMDGIYTTAGNDSILNAIQSEGLIGQVKLACIDVTNSTGDFFENGTQVWSGGGHYGTTQIAFAILYNYLADGTKIITDVNEPMRRHYLMIHDADEFDTFAAVAEGDVPVYVGSEIKAMIHYFNEAVDTDYFVAVNEAYSIADIATRHADLLK